ncbi:MAG: adenylyltransferase/cytidyltransferase family protein [Candidatus Lokiarchaeota archaeon]|nr:adenylyltransferase/cytidyltransferase family protein [Candidatus Lokiarchaeota archaeon]
MGEKSCKTVLIAGTFDLIHPGHLHLIEAAAKLGRVVVVVGTDAVVEKIKGHKPVIPEKQRLFVVSRIQGVDEAILGYETMDFTRIISDVKPDIILLGPDQGPSVEAWQSMLAQKGMPGIEITRLKERINDFPLTSTRDIMAKIKNQAGSQ